MSYKLKAIAACTKDNVIGFKGSKKIPWYYSSDLKKFRELTWNKTIIMGRSTLVSIGRALPNRKNYVLTRNDDAALINMVVAHSSLETLLPVLEGECWIIGGQSIYELFMPLIEEIHLTVVPDVIKVANLNSLAYFPTIDETFWKKETESTEQINGNQFLTHIKYAKNNSLHV